MGQSELLAYLCSHLEKLGLRYLITGSQATIAFGEPRFTNDIDVVVKLDATSLDTFCDGFPAEEFYLNRETAHQAVVECGMFNIIHPRSGLKIDVIIPQSVPYDELRMSRGVRIALPDGSLATFTSPEDIVVKKMEWHSLGGGERHLRDIQGILRVRGDELDREYISHHAENLGLQSVWREILSKQS